MNRKEKVELQWSIGNWYIQRRIAMRLSLILARWSWRNSKSENKLHKIKLFVSEFEPSTSRLAVTVTCLPDEWRGHHVTLLYQGPMLCYITCFFIIIIIGYFFITFLCSSSLFFIRVCHERANRKEEGKNGPVACWECFLLFSVQVFVTGRWKRGLSSV